MRAGCKFEGISDALPLAEIFYYKENTMYKRIIIIVIFLLLVGCNSENNNQVKIEDYDGFRSEIQTKYIELDELVNQIEGELKFKDGEIALQKKEIDNLKKRIVTLESSIDMQHRDMNYVLNQDSYRAYTSELLNDIITELEDYSTIRGIITNYDEKNDFLEIDVLEYIAYYDEKRIEELGIDTDNELIISGAYIYNDPNDDRKYQLNDRLKIYLYQDGDPGEMVGSSNEDLISKMSETPNLSYTFHLVNDVVIRISEDFHN